MNEKQRDSVVDYLPQRDHTALWVMHHIIMFDHLAVIAEQATAGIGGQRHPVFIGAHRCAGSIEAMLAEAYMADTERTAFDGKIFKLPGIDQRYCIRIAWHSCLLGKTTKDWFDCPHFAVINGECKLI
ncbi:hypothetical protein OZX74_06760 [Bifidobacterium sp. ESL0798]|uniref:hypothetical protein n=1 Tax=Bifidobacterium sp. ESL0798 TaxID=2983235 RepID=UPI0023F7B27C|nr:hypothetical protein [Bifidobacterium sp. ESL0798]WEV73612.1 hypothetical protein OZX74_06760 [Bifidobacterium sp. ESL0798]